MATAMTWMDRPSRKPSRTRPPIERYRSAGFALGPNRQLIRRKKTSCVSERVSVMACVLPEGGFAHAVPVQFAGEFDLAVVKFFSCWSAADQILSSRTTSFKNAKQVLVASCVDAASPLWIGARCSPCHCRADNCRCRHTFCTRPPKRVACHKYAMSERDIQRPRTSCISRNRCRRGKLSS